MGKLYRLLELERLERPDFFSETYDEIVAERKEEDDRLGSIPHLSLPKKRDATSIALFFSDRVIDERLLFCPRIDRDSGFIFLHRSRRGVYCHADIKWLDGTSVRYVPGASIALLPTIFLLPQWKLTYTLITDTREPAMAAFLRKRIHGLRRLRAWSLE